MRPDPQNFLLKTAGLLIIFVSSLLRVSLAAACEGIPPVVLLRDGARVEVDADSGVRLQGTLLRPEVLDIRPGEAQPSIPLKVANEVTENKDLRPWWQVLFSNQTELTAVTIPKLIEIRPERVLDADLSYELRLREGEAIVRMQLYFLGGIQKRSCSDGVKIIPIAVFERTRPTSVGK